MSVKGKTETLLLNFFPFVQSEYKNVWVYEVYEKTTVHSFTLIKGVRCKYIIVHLEDM